MLASSLVAGLIAILTIPAAIRYSEWRRRVDERVQSYKRAEARARSLGRKLVVIGDPKGGVTHDDYGYGNVCIDLTGCKDAPSTVTAIQADIADGLPIETDSTVVFIPYVLELVPDIDQAWAEILRIAGSQENVFMLALQPGRDMAAYTYPGVVAPGVLWSITSLPPDRPFEYERFERRGLIARRL